MPVKGFAGGPCRPDRDRQALCCAIRVSLVGLCGIISGMVGGRGNARVEWEIRNLRALEVDVHQPMTCFG